MFLFSLRIKNEFDDGPPPLVDIATLRKLLELLRLDAVPILLKVRLVIKTDYFNFVDFEEIFHYLLVQNLHSFILMDQMVGSEKDQGGPEYMVNLEGIITALKGKVTLSYITEYNHELILHGNIRRLDIRLQWTDSERQVGVSWSC